MRRSSVLLGGTAPAFLVVAAGALGHGGDKHIGADVVGRDGAHNRAVVDLRWSYECGEGRSASYEWTLKLRRVLPKPEQTTTLVSGSEKAGVARVRLAPGVYEPFADPFRCTSFGGGLDRAEIGVAFTVPDYCAWSVAVARGAAAVGRSGRRKTLAAGDVVRPGDTVVTAKRGRLEIELRDGNGFAALGARTRVGIDVRRCAQTGAWRLDLAEGRVTSGVNRPIDSRRRYEVRTPNATVRGAPGAWEAETSMRRGRVQTRIVALERTVTVTVGRARPLVLRAGFETVVTGAAAPSKPRPAGR